MFSSGQQRVEMMMMHDEVYDISEVRIYNVYQIKRKTLDTPIRILNYRTKTKSVILLNQTQHAFLYSFPEHTQNTWTNYTYRHIRSYM